MTRLQILLEAYNNYDKIYSFLIMLSLWAACFGHFLDWALPHRGRILITVFWGLLTVGYVTGVLSIGLAF